MIVFCSNSSIDDFYPGQITYVAEEGSSVPHAVRVAGAFDDLLDPPVLPYKATAEPRVLTADEFA